MASKRRCRPGAAPQHRRLGDKGGDWELAEQDGVTFDDLGSHIGITSTSFSWAGHGSRCKAWVQGREGRSLKSPLSVGAVALTQCQDGG